MVYIRPQDRGMGHVVVPYGAAAGQYPMAQPQRWDPFGLGAVPAAADLDAFKARYATLKAAIYEANAQSDDPLPVATLTNNVSRMDNVYKAVIAGDYARAPALENTARGILAAVGQTHPSTAMEDLLRDILLIPSRLASGLVASGQVVGDTLKAAGFDPTIIFASAGALGLAYLAYKFL